MGNTVTVGIFLAVLELYISVAQALVFWLHTCTVPATGNIKMKRVQTCLVAKLKCVCIHHAQVMVGTVKCSKHDFKTAANQPTSLR